MRNKTPSPPCHSFDFVIFYILDNYSFLQNCQVTSCIFSVRRRIGFCVIGKGNCFARGTNFFFRNGAFAPVGTCRADLRSKFERLMCRYARNGARASPERMKSWYSCITSFAAPYTQSYTRRLICIVLITTFPLKSFLVKTLSCRPAS